MFMLVLRLLVMLALIAAGTAHAQTYPVKPIRILTGATGGGVDFTARMVQQGLLAAYGQPVVVDNRGGGGGIVAGDMTAKAPPDGYTLLVYSGNIWLLPLLQDKVPYDPVRDFAPITLISTAPNTLVVNPELPVKTVKDLIALAKANPGKLNYAHAGIGGVTHLGAELFASMAGIKIVPVAFKANPFAFADLINGQVQIMFAVATSVAPLVKSGRLRAIAVSTAKRTELAPGLPTIAESGLPGYENAALLAMFAPIKTSPAMIERLNRVVVAWIKSSEVKEKFFNGGADVIGSTPEELAVAMKADIVRWAKVIKESGIHVEP
jgi:tripartite-type tricarboxylate transporter receptor subunit TctC